ncbi:MAG TPA: hypothetical protein VLW17_05405 [Thermoanaerobaculaceae bacterium]|nr:hypothetical protein [Thermoanaerobaculaceae bacterium]
MRAIIERPSWRGALLLAPVLVVLFVIGCVTGRGQPHMENALAELQSAKSELQSAVTDKGGHRVRAIELVDRAIDQVNAGISFAASRH